MEKILEILNSGEGFPVPKNIKLSKPLDKIHSIIYKWRQEKGLDQSEADYLRKCLKIAPLLGNPLEYVPEFETPSQEYILQELEKEKQKEINKIPEGAKEIFEEKQETQEQQQETE